MSGDLPITANPIAMNPIAMNKGFTLIELMIGMVLGLIISAAAVSAFVAHSRTVYQQMAYNQAAEDVNEAYAVLSRLLLQAQRDSITVTTTESEGALAATTIDFELPAGFSVWPNTEAPFADNWVRIAWSSSGSNADQVLLSKATTSGGLDSGTATVLAGGASGNNTRFTSLNLVSDGGDPATHTFSISGKSFVRDQVNGDDDGLGLTVAGRILPRN